MDSGQEALSVLPTRAEVSVPGAGPAPAPSLELPAAARELLMSRGSQQGLRRDRSPLFPGDIASPWGVWVEGREQQLQESWGDAGACWNAHECVGCGCVCVQVFHAEMWVCLSIWCISVSLRVKVFVQQCDHICVILSVRLYIGDWSVCLCASMSLCAV